MMNKMNMRSEPKYLAISLDDKLEYTVLYPFSCFIIISIPLSAVSVILSTIPLSDALTGVPLLALIISLPIFQ